MNTLTPMAEPLRSRIRIFDPQQDFAIVHRRLPHWSQAGTISFLTWRTWDSIPRRVLEAWLKERAAWLLQLGVDPTRPNWEAQLKAHGPARLQEFQQYVSDRWNEQLDACHGQCVLRQSDVSRIVADSLLHFDGDRYDLTDFVIMPNHVHVLVAFPDEDSMLRQCDSWKHFTATQINKLVRRTGRFWQQDGFDHLVRSPEQFAYLRWYITDNPRRANLRTGQFKHFSKPV